MRKEEADVVRYCHFRRRRSFFGGRMDPTSESDVQQLIQIEGPKFGCQLMRNNSGAFTDKDGRSVRYGLGNISKKHSEQIKSSDLIGFKRVVITPEMVGQTVAIIASVEVKKPDWNPKKLLDKKETAQKTWNDWIVANGGFGGFSNSVESFKKIIGV